MNKRSFFLGVLVGVIVSIICLFIIGFMYNDNGHVYSGRFQMLETPVVFEGKTVTRCKVIQVLRDGALAKDCDDEYMDSFYGTTVLIPKDGYYDDQIVTISKPMHLGTYSYITTAGTRATVPVVDGEIQ